MSGLEPSGPSMKTPLSPESDLTRGAEVINFADGSPGVTKRSSRRGEIRFRDFQSGEQSLGQGFSNQAANAALPETVAKRFSLIQPGPQIKKM